jgi:drug/metabolite transporter (DMT)-like permease
MMKKCSSLTLVEIICIILLSLLTIFSGMVMFDIDKNHNTPLLNSLFVKSAGIIAVICVGIFMFKESYQLHQFIGIALILIGVYLCSSKEISFFQKK